MNDVTHYAKNVDQLILSTYGTHLPPQHTTAWSHNDATNLLHQHANAAQQTHDPIARNSLGHYHYIPYYPYRFVDCMKDIRKLFPQHTHFVDVGCGIGDKLLLAKELVGYEQVSGVEYDPVTFKIAEATVGSIASTLMNADANTVDFSAFDVVYMYCPIREEPQMRRLFIHIARTMKEGAIILDMLPSYARDMRSKRFQSLFAAPRKASWDVRHNFLYQKRGKLLYQEGLNDVA